MSIHRILLVEDDEFVAEVAEAILEELGYQCARAVDGRAALEALEIGEFDLVVSDVVMPRMDGIQLYAEARQRWPNLPFVLTSGYYEMLEGAEKALPAGFTILQKPYKVEDLLIEMDKAVKLVGGVGLIEEAA